MNVFVYGTLLAGLGNFHVMERSEGKFLRKDTIKGRMFTERFSFPFISLKDPLNYKIHGEIYEVKSFTFLDHLEGYQVGRPNNFYNRTIVTTESGLKTYVYERTDCRSSCFWIIHGDWKRQKQEENMAKPMPFAVQDTNFPRPKECSQFWYKLLKYLSLNPEEEVSIPTFAYRSIEYASEKTGIKIHRILDKNRAYYNISLTKTDQIFFEIQKKAQ
jgi:gamma-glutamylcyclotransferase (GGCT)/AIG2-like uncharacterized protein YtfP